MFFCVATAIFYTTLNHLNFNIKSSIIIVFTNSILVLILLIAVFFNGLNILSFFFYLLISCVVLYIMFSSKNVIVFLLTLKSYYIFLVSLLMVLSLSELLTQKNLYLLMEEPSWFALAFLITSLLYGLLEGLLIKNLGKEKLDYLLDSMNTLIPISMLILLLIKNCSLLYVLFFSRHAPLVTLVILASTLLEIYFGVFLVMGILKAYALSLYKHKNQILNMQYNLQMAHLKQLESYQTEIRRISHDIHNHKTVMYSLIQEKDYDNALKYLEHYGTGFNSESFEILTPNKVLNALLLSKREVCLNHNIQLDLDIHLPTDLGISDFDLCIIVGNLIDNAIEASQKITPTGKGYIKIKSTLINHNFVWDIKNNFDTSLHMTKGKLLTLKKDKLNHGLGLSNIQSIVDKYNGTCQLTFDQDVFSAFIRIPLD